ncbi:MAG TPA: mechanosensitive ion channel family protein [Sphingobacteriaceae bacterium]|nr:mechanosensitive ion channel family protein [Sphingobacteriaceae bacterium]
MDFHKIYLQGYTWITVQGLKIVIAFILLFIGLWLIGLVSGWIRKHMDRREFDPSLKPFLLSFLVISLRILLVLGLMQFMGVQMTIFAAVITSFGVAAGLALSGTLQNFASGILILSLKPYRVGDNILAQGQEGTVTEIQLFYTYVNTYDNRTVIFPNSKLSNEVIINISRQGKRRLDIELKLNYAVDFNHLKIVIEKTIASQLKLLKEPASSVTVSALDADGYKTLISVWVDAHGFNDAKLVFQEKLINDIKQASIQLPGIPVEPGV